MKIKWLFKSTKLWSGWVGVGTQVWMQRSPSVLCPAKFTGITVSKKLEEMPKDSRLCYIIQLMFFYFTFNYQEISCQGLKSKCSRSKGQSSMSVMCHWLISCWTLARKRILPTMNYSLQIHSSSLQKKERIFSFALRNPFWNFPWAICTLTDLSSATAHSSFFNISYWDLLILKRMKFKFVMILLVCFIFLLGLCCSSGFFLVAANGGYSRVVVCGLLLLWSRGSRVWWL